MKSQTLRFNYEFSRVYKRGTFFAGRFITIHAFRRYPGLKHNTTLIKPDIVRVGFCANKKQLGAVGRNRARRLMRESYRKIEYLIPEGYDLVFTLKNNCEVPTYRDVEKDTLRGLRLLGLLADKTDSGEDR
ncbi:MAG: ribonuclease P protein component [Clostridiales bacterium]|nr:ribonuclease P protein component [Clostridiales bacterium]